MTQMLELSDFMAAIVIMLNEKSKICSQWMRKKEILEK